MLYILKLILLVASTLALATAGATYDPARSRMMATAAQIAYCSDVDAVEKWTCGTCKESGLPIVPGKVRVIDQTELTNAHATRVMIAKLDQGCIVSFRGSDNVANWIADLNTASATLPKNEHCPDCWVEEGFHSVWKNVTHKVVHGLAGIGCKKHGADNKLYITGHSLGAAVAHLAMFTLESMGFEVMESYSYESPRVGNSAFAAAFDEKFGRKNSVWRVTHYEDPVVHLPYGTFGYEHVETEVYYDDKGNWKICQGNEDPTCSMQWTMNLFKSDQHCASPLVPSGDICNGCDTIAKSMNPMRFLAV